MREGLFVGHEVVEDEVGVVSVVLRALQADALVLDVQSNGRGAKVDGDGRVQCGFVEQVEGQLGSAD